MLSDREPTISFIIPAYNCQDTLGETLESVFDGNFQNGDEVIIINDCSTDNTLSVIENFQEKHSGIRLLQHKI